MQVCAIGLQKTMPITLDSKIGVIVVVQKANDLNEYRLAQKTLRCYCGIHDYPLILVDISKNVTLQKMCPQNDVCTSYH